MERFSRATATVNALELSKHRQMRFNSSNIGLCAMIIYVRCIVETALKFQDNGRFARTCKILPNLDGENMLDCARSS